MMEDFEIALRFSQTELRMTVLSVASDPESSTLTSAIGTTFPSVKPIPQPGAELLKWSDLVRDRRELWPVQYLLPGGAYIQ
jgi:hypothetical protein